MATSVDLRSCVFGQDVASLLNRDYKKNLVYLLYGMTTGAKYKIFSIPKRSGGTRLISAPSVALLHLQQQLAELLAKDFTPRASAHGFIQRRSISSNADRHVGQRWVLNIDLRDFFGTITFPRIYGRLQANPYNYSPDAARIVAHAACVSGALATGGALSPILSNILCDKLDAEMARFAKQFGCQYTRYADDITISTNRYRFPAEIAYFADDESPTETTLGSQLTDIVTQNGFVINASKTRLLGKGVRQEVTGLVVNQKRNVPREYVRQVRCMLHAWERYGLAAASKDHFTKWRRDRGRLAAYEATDFEWVLRGKIEFLRSVRGSTDAVFSALATRFNALATGARFKIVPHTTGEVIAEAVWVVEGQRETTIEDKIEVDSLVQRFLRRLGIATIPKHRIQKRIVGEPYIGTAFFLSGVGIVTCEHCVTPGATIRHSGKGLAHAVGRKRGSPENDVCIVDAVDPLPIGLKPKATLSAATASEIGALNVGDEVQIAGFPANLPENQVSLKTAKITRFLTHGFRNRPLGASERQIVLDGGILEGNSGGPVLFKGKVIGVAVKGAGAENATGASIVVPITVL